MQPGRVTLRSSMSVTYLLEYVPEGPKRSFSRFYEEYQSDHRFDESNTVELPQIDHQVLATSCFEHAGHIRLPQKTFPDIENKLIRESC